MSPERIPTRRCPSPRARSISQPYVVGVMLQALELLPTHRVLEVGAGSGYVTAILSNLVAEVRAVEWHAALAESAGRRLDQLGIRNVAIRVGDGTLGWADKAPFDGILVSACGPAVPQRLLQQLAPGGRLVMPVGSHDAQSLLRISRSNDGRSTRQDDLGSVAFVPLLSTP